VPRSSSPIEVAHEQLRPDVVRFSSNRSFGISAAVFLAVIALAPLLKSRPVNRFVLLAASVALFLALVWPGVLGPLHRLFFRIALVLHAIASPILMAVLFFGLLTPTGYFRRRWGRSALKLEVSLGNPATYWEAREAGVSSMNATF